MAEWIRACGLEDCPPGKLMGVRCGDTAICLANSGGTLYAFEDRCSHQDYPLSEGTLEDGTLECVFHGARFDLESGRAVALPAIRPIKTFPVEVRDSDVYVEVED